MAPLINENDYMFVDISDFDFYSTADVNTKESTSASLHVASTERRVSFATHVTSRDVMNRDGYTAEEMTATWYDRSLLRQMKECAKSEARLVESGVLVEGGDVSIRGLEAKTSKGVRRRRQSRMNAYAAVFLEIDTQQNMGMSDDDAIADAYYTYSEPCLVAAHMIAVRDAEDAKAALQSMKMETQFGASLLWNHLATPASDLLFSHAA